MSQAANCQEDCGCARPEARGAAEVEAQKEVGSLAAMGQERALLSDGCISLGGQPSREHAGREGDFKDCIGLKPFVQCTYLSSA